MNLFKINLTKEKLEAFFKGFLFVTIISLFGYFIINIVNSSNKKQIEEIKKARIQDSIVAAKATHERDNLVKINQQLLRESGKLQGEVTASKFILSRVEFGLGQTLKQLKDLENEKDFIPTDVSADEQYRYLSKVKYKPYEPK